MLKMKKYLTVGLFILVSSCLIVSEKDKFYEDIKRGDKTMGYVSVCEGAAMYSTDTNKMFANFYLSLCVAQLLEEEKCKSKSNWIPTIDGRM